MKKNHITTIDLWGRKVPLVDTVRINFGFLEIYSEAKPYDGRFELKTGNGYRNFYWVQSNDIAAASRRGEISSRESSHQGWNMAESLGEASRMWCYILANALTFGEADYV